MVVSHLLHSKDDSQQSYFRIKLSTSISNQRIHFSPNFPKTLSPALGIPNRKINDQIIALRPLEFQSVKYVGQLQ
jgi:hypothetical protein